MVAFDAHSVPSGDAPVESVIQRVNDVKNLPTGSAGEVRVRAEIGVEPALAAGARQLAHLAELREDVEVPIDCRQAEPGLAGPHGLVELLCGRVAPGCLERGEDGAALPRHPVRGPAEDR